MGEVPASGLPGGGAPVPPPPPVPVYLKILVFLAGLAVMGAERAAPRLLAPSFGTSQLIWTNIIGTVLASLTAGAWLGGRLADRWPTVRAYAAVLGLAGALLAGPLLALAAEALAAQRAGTFFLSLASVCLFFAPATLLLGMVGPWAVRLAGAGVGFTDDRAPVEFLTDQMLLRVARRP